MLKQFGITAGVLGVILLVSGCMNEQGPAFCKTERDRMHRNG